MLLLPVFSMILAGRSVVPTSTTTPHPLLPATITHMLLSLLVSVMLVGYCVVSTSINSHPLFPVTTTHMPLFLVVSVMLAGCSVVSTSPPLTLFSPLPPHTCCCPSWFQWCWLVSVLFLHPLHLTLFSSLPPHLLLSLVVLVMLVGYGAISTSPPPLTLFFHHHHTCCCLSWFHSVPCPPLVCFQFFSLVPIVSDDDCIQKRLIVSQF